MSSKISKILVVGTGKVGSLVGTLLGRAGFEVKGADLVANDGLGYPSAALDVSDDKALDAALSQQDAVVSCLPFQLNLTVAESAHARGVHYFDLTEDVSTTRAIIEISKEGPGVLAPQCGLAPGFVGIVGASLVAGFDSLRSIELRVGALPQKPTGKLGYAFNWSPEGVVNEYINDCEVIRDGVFQTFPALDLLEEIDIHGQKLEAFTTSGGLGTMCETYAGKVDNLNYKTIRYPGHCQAIRFLFDDLHLRENRKRAGDILIKACPPCDEDVVYVHAAVEGMKDGALARNGFVEAYFPLEIDGVEWRAISWTTASSVAAVVEMVSTGSLPDEGFIKQEEISLETFLSTTSGSLYKVPEA